MAVPMAVELLRVDPETRRCTLLLKALHEEWYLPIAIGAAEAVAIAAVNHSVPRPLTHDLIRAIIDHLGGRVTHVAIHTLRDGVFYARIVVDVSGRHAELDARPSDAVALAVRLGMPVQVEETVLAKAGLRSEEGGKSDSKDSGTESPVRDDQLGPFRDVIGGLNLDDLGK